MAALSPIGVTLEYGDSATTDTVVGAVTSITPGSTSVSMYDCTALTDTTVQKIPSGRVDPGSMSIECYIDPDDAGVSVDEIEVLMNAGTLKYWQIKFNNTGNDSTYVGQAYVSSVEIGSIQDDAIRYTITLEKTGGWAFTEAP